MKKLPIWILILIVWMALNTTWAITLWNQEKQDSKIKEIGTTTFHGTELKAWKTGSCYVFGIKSETGNPQPMFFSNCQGK